MDFEAPKNSLAHQALIEAVGKAGLNTIALRNLLWLINANPRLIAYAQVFDHLKAHFESPLFLQSNLNWASAWKNDISDWITVCSWIVQNRRKLVQRPELADFDLFRRGRHPHLHTGVSRHGVAAAIWNLHCDSKSHPHSKTTRSVAEAKYFELQGHLIASYAEARFRLSKLAFYESYDGQLERPVAPMATQLVGLAIREMSLPQYSHAIALLPSADSTARFAAEIGLFALSSQQRWTAANLLVREDTDRFLVAIRRYFHRFTDVLLGRRPTQYARTRGGGGGSGLKTHRHGFINVGPVWVLMEQEPGAPTDPDFIDPPGQAIWIDSLCSRVTKRSRGQKTTQKPGKTQNTSSVTAIEESGLSPAETLEEAFRLYAPEDYKGQIRSMYYQRLAAESSAQALGFDFNRLTPSEIRIVANHSLRPDSGALAKLESDIGVATAQTARLIVGVMLILGQQVQRACCMHFVWRAPATPLEDVQPIRGLPTLIINAPVEGDWNHATVDGFCMPGLSPDYNTDLPADLESIDSDSAECFVLPDLFGLGQQILQYLPAKITSDAYKKDSLVFDINEAAALKAVKAFCRSIQNRRMTPEKIAQALPALVTSLTGDQSLAWILCSDVRRKNQTRMFYTRHRVDHLIKVYFRAARHLSKITEIPLLKTSFQIAEPKFSPGVGARFVMSVPDVRDLLTNIQNQLTGDIPDDRNMLFFVWYHNAYVIYTHLFQSLDTSLRAITGPDDLFKITMTSVRDYGSAYASLSDKDTDYSSKARLVSIRKPIEDQFLNYEKHIKSLHLHISSLSSEIELQRDQLPFFVIAQNLDFKSLNPSFVEKALKFYTGYDVPANFHRAFLRTELLHRGCSAEVIDAHLGHANFGETPFSRHSSFDFRLHLQRIDAALQEIHEEIGLRPLKSLIERKRLPRSGP